jgi:hypothetical protein
METTSTASTASSMPMDGEFISADGDRIDRIISADGWGVRQCGVQHNTVWSVWFRLLCLAAWAEDQPTDRAFQSVQCNHQEWEDHVKAEGIAVSSRCEGFQSHEESFLAFYIYLIYSSHPVFCFVAT